jgi:hypothetical protein
MEIADAVEPINGSIHIEKIQRAFLYQFKAGPDLYKASSDERKRHLRDLHREAGAALFA